MALREGGGSTIKFSDDIMGWGRHSFFTPQPPKAGIVVACADGRRAVSGTL